MIARYKHGSVTWVDIEKPTKEEIDIIAKEFDLDAIVAQELLTPAERSKVDPYDSYVYLVFHFPFCVEGNGVCYEQEVDFIITKDHLITVRYGVINPIIEFAKKFETNILLDKRKFAHAGFLFYYLMLEFYDSLKRDLRHANYKLGAIEEDIFDNQERKMVKELSLVSRELIDFKRALRHHESLLDSFASIASNYFNNNYKHYIEAIIGEYKKAEGLLDSTREILYELRDTNDSLVSTKMNEIMKNLTIMAFITFPLSLLAAIFGMNTEYIPLVGHPYDFWIVIIGMLIGVIYMYAYFKYKKWI